MVEQMKRIFIIGILAVLLISTAGMTVTTAASSSTTQHYKFDVWDGNSLGTSPAPFGSIIIKKATDNTAWFTLTARGLWPSTQYWLYYQTTSGAWKYVKNAVATTDRRGTLTVTAAWTNPTDDLAAASTFAVFPEQITQLTIRLGDTYAWKPELSTTYFWAYFMVDGRLTDVNGAPIADQTITVGTRDEYGRVVPLIDSNTQLPVTAKTNSNGYWVASATVTQYFWVVQQLDANNHPLEKPPVDAYFAGDGTHPATWSYWTTTS
jgi:hypothetical protein